MFSAGTIKYVTAIVGTAVTSYLGGWDIAMKLLVIFLIADYSTGVLAAIKTKSLNSEVMFWGGVRKGIILVVILISVTLDQMVNNQIPIFRTLALYYYIAREGLSVIENIGKLGEIVPPFLAQFLTQIQTKNDPPKTEQK